MAARDGNLSHTLRKREAFASAKADRPHEKFARSLARHCIDRLALSSGGSRRHAEALSERTRKCTRRLETAFDRDLVDGQHADAQQAGCALEPLADQESVRRLAVDGTERADEVTWRVVRETRELVVVDLQVA